ncbi:MAG TPA: heavy metal-associated domain-containing protein [Ignavibacteria bacterium]|nr:heavy metal-associated domain-containing protein [Ignavibacteria bacterium]
MNHINFKTTGNFIILIILFSVLIYGCNKKDASTETDKLKDNKSTVANTETKTNNLNNEHVMINLPSMQCGTCKKNIEKAVNKLDGIESINVVVKEKAAHIDYDKSKLDLSKIESTINAAGYDANNTKADPEAYNNLDDCCKLPKDQKEKSGH